MYSIVSGSLAFVSLRRGPFLLVQDYQIANVDSAGTLKVTQNAPGKLPDTLASKRRRPKAAAGWVLDSVSWNLPGRVLGHFEGPRGGAQRVGGTVSVRNLVVPHQ